MKVHTNTKRVRQARKTVVRLLLSEHNGDCQTCDRGDDCELQALAGELGIRKIAYEGEKTRRRIDESTPALVRDTGKCIKCRRCVSVCVEVQHVEAIFPQDRGFNTVIGPAFDNDHDTVACVQCGQCAAVCPVGAITEKDQIEDVWKAIDAPDTHVVVQTAPAIRAAGIDFQNLPDEEMDAPLGLSTGAADIFANTGGVMVAALRTAYELVTGRELPSENLHVAPVEGLEGVKEASLKIENPLNEWKFLDGVTLNVAVAHGLGNANRVVEAIRSGQKQYHFVEVMTCPGGCIGGGGQPRFTTNEVREARIKAIYREDEGKALRKSHENPEIAQIYKEFLGKPLGKLSHDLLHTKYTPRDKT